MTPRLLLCVQIERCLVMLHLHGDVAISTFVARGCSAACLVQLLACRQLVPNFVTPSVASLVNTCPMKAQCETNVPVPVPAGDHRGAEQGGGPAAQDAAGLAGAREACQPAARGQPQARAVRPAVRTPAPYCVMAWRCSLCLALPTPHLGAVGASIQSPHVSGRYHGMQL